MLPESTLASIVPPAPAVPPPPPFPAAPDAPAAPPAPPAPPAPVPPLPISHESLTGSYLGKHPDVMGAVWMTLPSRAGLVSKVTPNERASHGFVGGTVGSLGRSLSAQ